MSSCFISDLHLHEKRKDIKNSFFNFLESEATRFENLYILGDLFEVWIGDDLQDNFSKEVIKKLKLFSKDNKNIFIMHGNRDFLLGEKFANLCGAKILPDPYILESGKKKIMLSHGDIFCIDDIEYQKFKSTVRTPEWKKDFLSKSIFERNEIARQLRKESSKKNSEKEDFLMDVNKLEIEKIALENKIDILIHGHVHRPKVHDEIFGERFVLGDWDEKYWFISLDGEKIELMSGSI